MGLGKIKPILNGEEDGIKEWWVGKKIDKT